METPQQRGKENKVKDIYLLLTKSDTFISKAIYLMTQDSYTHISISFEENLQPMYSCARKYTYSPIPAGIRNESFEKGFYNPYRRNHYYFCSEFVSEILAYSQAIELPKLPCLMKPSDYLLFEELECLYQGNIGELIKYRDLC